MCTVKIFCSFFQVAESNNHMSKQSNNGDCGGTLDGCTKKSHSSKVSSVGSFDKQVFIYRVIEKRIFQTKKTVSVKKCISWISLS